MAVSQNICVRCDFSVRLGETILQTMRRDAAPVGTGRGLSNAPLPKRWANLRSDTKGQGKWEAKSHRHDRERWFWGAWPLSVAGGRPNTALQAWRPEASVGEAGQKVSSSLLRQV